MNLVLPSLPPYVEQCVWNHLVFLRLEEQSLLNTVGLFLVAVWLRDFVFCYLFCDYLVLRNSFMNFGPDTFHGSNSL